MVISSEISGKCICEITLRAQHMPQSGAQPRHRSLARGVRDVWAWAGGRFGYDSPWVKQSDFQRHVWVPTQS